MIVAAGLSPAWQQIILLDRLRQGEVNRARQVQWCASGKVLNVAVALAHLGANSRVVTLLGGPPKPLIERQLSSFGIEHDSVEGHWATRICTTIVEQDGQATELVESAGPVTAAESEAFVSAFHERSRDATSVVLSGSIGRWTQPGIYRDLLVNTSASAILDIRGPELLEALHARPLLVKPNREELSQTLGRSLESDAELQRAMRELIDRGASWVVVTHGKNPAWVASQDQFFRMKPPRVEPINPIGSGDCMAAAIAWALEAGKAPLDAVRLGIAAGAENARELLPARLDPQRVLSLAEQVQLELA